MLPGFNSFRFYRIPYRVFLTFVLFTVMVPVRESPLFAAPGEPSRAKDLFVSQITLDPGDSNTLYALTTYSVGLLKSSDAGRTWSQINKGIRSFSLYQAMVHPRDSNIVYIGAGGAGLYKSTDSGMSWMEMNQGLQNTDIGYMVQHPEEPDTVYVCTSTGLFKTENGGESWIPLNQGDDFSTSQQFQSFVVIPTSPPTLYLASIKGIYARREGDEGWRSIGEPFSGKQVTALAHHPGTGRLYAAVLRKGKAGVSQGGGLYVSDPQKKRWSRLGSGLDQAWIRLIHIDPSNPKVIYLATTGRGVLKSVDGGRTWEEHNRGITDPDLDIRSLVLDPNDSSTLYAGSHGYWIFRSKDGARNWEPLPIGSYETSGEIRERLTREDSLFLEEGGRERSGEFPPPEFQKCNKCHGWTDPLINHSTGTWRVAANPRAWAPSVKRMADVSGLTPEEEARITRFLNLYTRKKGNPKPDFPRGLEGRVKGEIPISIIKGAEEEDPVAEWDGDNYMVVWQSNRKAPGNYDVYGARISREGERLDPEGFLVSTAPSNQNFPDIAWGEGRYLVVWQDLRSGKRWEIYGARVLPNGEILDPDGIRLSELEGNAQYPQVAWDGKNFLAVWMEESPDKGWEVAGVRVSPEGKIIDQQRISLNSAPGDQDHPVLAWGKDAYLVVWSDHKAGGESVITATRIDPKGRILDPEGIILSPSPNRESVFPAVAWADGRFIVAWSDQTRGRPSAIRGTVLGSSGKEEEALRFTAGTGPGLKTFPALGCRKEECLLTWEEDRGSSGSLTVIDNLVRDVAGTWIDFTGSRPSLKEVMIAPGAVGNHFSKVASDGFAYLVVWKDYGTGRAAGLGRFVEPPPVK